MPETGGKPHVERSAAVSGHRLRRASFVLLALACAFTLFLSGDVGVGQAQSVQEVVLVSNTEQIPWSASYVAGNASGLSATQGFHTGDDPGGYTLSTVGIGLLTNQFSGEETLILHIYSSNSDGTANALLYTPQPPGNARVGHIGPGHRGLYRPCREHPGSRTPITTWSSRHQATMATMRGSE